MSPMFVEKIQSGIRWRVTTGERFCGGDQQEPDAAAAGLGVAAFLPINLANRKGKLRRGDWWVGGIPGCGLVDGEARCSVLGAR